MASVTKSNDEKSPMADEDLPDEQAVEETDEPAKPLAKAGKGQPAEVRRATAPAGSGFFTIYKRGHGYWTRVGTVCGVALVGLFTAYNLKVYVPTFMPDTVSQITGTRIGIGVALGFIAAYAYIAWRMMNKPDNVEFLIATDSEMKKVNWTSRRELIGSTKVVVGFMFLTALFLFFCDVFFSAVFKMTGVLKFDYFGK